MKLILSHQAALFGTSTNDGPNDAVSSFEIHIHSSTYIDSANRCFFECGDTRSVDDHMVGWQIAERVLIKSQICSIVLSVIQQLLKKGEYIYGQR